MQNYSAYEEPENLKMHEKRQSTDANVEMTQLSESPDKDFKAVIIKMPQYSRWTLLKQIKRHKLSGKKQKP